MPFTQIASKGRFYGAKWLLLILLFFCFPGDAAADASFTFKPRISARFLYDDNVFLEPADEESDVGTAVRPGLDLMARGRNRELALTYNAAYTAYTRFPENNFWSHDLSLNAWAEIARSLRFQFQDAFLRTEDPISEAESALRRGRNPYHTNTAVIGIKNRFGAEDVLELRYESYILKNVDSTIEDKSYQKPSVQATYWLSPNRYALQLEGSYTTSDFETSEDFEAMAARSRLSRRFGPRLEAYIEYSHVYTDYLDSGDDYRIYNPTAGFSWQEEKNTAFAASFGWFYRDNEIGDDDEGIVGTIETVYSWAAESSAAFTGEAGYRLASFGAEDLGFNPFYSLQGTVTHSLGHRMVGNLFAGYRLDWYLDEDPDREDALWRAGVSLAYQALSWLTFRLEYLFQRVDSNIETEDYTDNRAILSVGLAPRQPVKPFKRP